MIVVWADFRPRETTMAQFYKANTVRELIAVLEKLDPSKEVWIDRLYDLQPLGIVDGDVVGFFSLND